ncbi:hypothetical protein GIB67_008901 [Kingdonia uniflora]|uniref:Piwi domain-containing protein n=1 Tax=Kingdonia uniflora TaxID=39325 RepID=A0A7J7LVH1_9MAGN|nr:hypothetical protein GIB67_008901 [Kingdonia uniflora]
MLRRYAKSLSIFQRSSLVEKSRQKPKESLSVLSDTLEAGKYDDDQILKSCGIKTDSKFTQVKGIPRHRAWKDLKAESLNKDNKNNHPCLTKEVLYRSLSYNKSSQSLSDLESEEVQGFKDLGFTFNDEDLNLNVINIVPGLQRQKTFNYAEEQMKRLYLSEAWFLQRYAQSIPDNWIDHDQRSDGGDVKTQLKFWARMVASNKLVEPTRVNDQYLINILLKINENLGGLNSMLTTEHGLNIPMISKAPTMMLGMDVSHGSPGQADVLSISVMVSSRQWSSISRYRACVRTLSPKVEMVVALFKRDSNTIDANIIQ